MDEETKKAILETRDLMREMVGIMREQKAMAEKMSQRAANAHMNLAKFAEALPPQAKTMLGNLMNMGKKEG